MQDRNRRNILELTGQFYPSGMACQGQNGYPGQMTVAEHAPDRSGRWTVKGRATRARIVETAAALMYERGVAGTSTEDIRDAAGVSNSQLYHYFAGKDDLTHAVIAYQVEQVLAVQQPLLSGLESFAALQA